MLLEATLLSIRGTVRHSKGILREMLTVATQRKKFCLGNIIRRLKRAKLAKKIFTLGEVGRFPLRHNPQNAIFADNTHDQRSYKRMFFFKQKLIKANY